MQVKICHVTSAHKPFDGRIFEKECSSLAKKYEVYLIAPNAKDCLKNNIHILGAAITGGRFRRQLSLKNIYKRMEEVDADIYHFHEPELIPYALKIKKKGKKIIFDSHEDVPAMIANMQYLPKWIRAIAVPIYSCYEKVSLRKFDGVISVDPRIVERLKKINTNTVMVTNFPKYVDILISDNRKKQVCFTGGIGPLWLVDSIVKSLNKVNVKCILAGYTDDDYLQYLKTLPSWNKSEYLGYIAHDESLDIQRSSIAGMALLDYGDIVGGKWGTLGNTKLFEYMMAGTPVIATNFILWQEIIDKYHCGICVNPHDINSIASAIQYLQDHPDEAYSMGVNGKRAVELEYNWGRQEKILFDFYSNILEQ